MKYTKCATLLVKKEIFGIMKLSKGKSRLDILGRVGVIDVRTKNNNSMCVFT